MLFNSLHFAAFFPVVVCAYFLLPHRLRWMLLLAASYYFYGSWSWKYLALLLLTTSVDWFAGVRMGATTHTGRRRAWLITSLVCNLGVLFAFKYYNFFVDSAQLAAAALGLSIPVSVIEVLLPVGISFYTFQSISYTVDVYRGTTAPQRHFGKFALFVAFFPQLVAGPIERSWHLMPQIDIHKRFDWNRIRSGVLLMLAGFFKKIVIADRLAIYVDAVYNDPAAYEGWPIVIATYLFAFQIFCDFSGYSDIAIGSARVLGFDLMKNFQRPYFATSVTDFWHRWHISLSTWMRDYLYIPLGGNRVAPRRVYFNLFIVFVLSGLWHGAHWKFIWWGALHGLYICAGRYFPTSRRTLITRVIGTEASPLRRVFQVIVTFHLVLFAWMFFRANSVTDVYVLIVRAASGLGASASTIFDPLPATELGIAIVALCLLEAVHLLQERGIHIEERLVALPRPARWAIYYSLAFTVLFFGKFTSQQFIYFQF
ncbi:MAG: MBOAT family O-acyltransferase [Candidatus Hydrogenedentes bacterium]|nr:MBOAT family O-acyltransferase [Candidatus Hydrogenedentota bacterium]